MKKINTDPNDLMGLLTETPPKVFRKPNDPRIVWKVVLPKGGGMESHIRGLDKYPYPGYINREAAKTIEFIKGEFKLLLGHFSPMKKSNLFQFIFLKRILQRFIPKWLNFAVWVMRDVQLKPRLYSHSVREIYRVFDIMIEREENLDMKSKWRNIRDIVCMVLEVDKSYRFRVQDILSEIDIDKIKLDKADRYFTPFEQLGYNFGKKDES